MEEQRSNEMNTPEQRPVDVRSVIREAITEFVSAEREKAEPAYKAELVEERRRREELERRLNDVVEENRRSRQLAEELDRQGKIRNELQRLGVAKVDLAFKAVKDDIQRTTDGRLVARSGQDEMDAREYLSQFVSENPEFLPARITGGSGVAATQRTTGASGVDLDKLRPGMNAEELERIRQEIARVASQTMRGA
jgi:ribosomal protein S18